MWLSDPVSKQKFFKVMAENGMFAVQSLCIRPEDTLNLSAFVRTVLATLGTRTRQYFAEKSILCDGTVNYGAVMFMRVFKAGSTLPMLVKLDAKKIELEAYNTVAETLQNQNLAGLVKCEVHLVEFKMLIVR